MKKRKTIINMIDELIDDFLSLDEVISSVKDSTSAYSKDGNDKPDEDLKAEADKDCDCGVNVNTPNNSNREHPVDSNGAPWNVINTVADLPKNSGMYIVTVEEYFFTINCIHSGKPRCERSSVFAWYDDEKKIWDIESRGKIIDAKRTIYDPLPEPIRVVAWKTFPTPFEG